MMLTIQQAAERLGKSRRQVRYMIQTGRLAATRVGGQWRVDEGALPQSKGQRAAEARKQEQLAMAVSEALALPAGGKRRRYSLVNLRAFQIASPLYRQAVGALGAEHAACVALHLSIAELARGCHRFDHAGKAAAYRAARDAASRAACELALSDHDRAGAFLDQIEQELMAALAGLIRRLDRPRRQTSQAAEALS